MAVVAIFARRGIKLAISQCQSMSAGTIGIRLRFMAPGAVDRLGGDLVVGMILRDIGVAAGTTIGSVNRGANPFLIYVEQNTLSGGVCLVQILIGVTIHASTILDLFSGDPREWRKQDERQAKGEETEVVYARNHN